jgi:hypothetical protein
MSARRSGRGERGQAAVELALGGVLFVAIIMLGIYLSELSFFTLKVQEANAFAMYEVTRSRSHLYSQGKLGSQASIYQDVSKTEERVETRTQARYADFNGAANGAPGAKLVFAKGMNLEVECGQRNGGFALPPVGGMPGRDVRRDTSNALGRYYRDAAMGCSTEAEVTSVGLPRFFWQDTGGGYAREAFSKDLTLKLCGAGRAAGGSCPGEYKVLMGDWAIEGPPGSMLNADHTVAERNDAFDRNDSYHDIVRHLFEQSGQKYDANRDVGRSPAMEFARWIGGYVPDGPHMGAPMDERAFYMSYAGPEHDYLDSLAGAPSSSGASCTLCHYNTTGTSPVTGPQAYMPDPNWKKIRSRCFLGLPGC